MERREGEEVESVRREGEGSSSLTLFFQAHISRPSVYLVGTHLDHKKFHGNRNLVDEKLERLRVSLHWVEDQFTEIWLTAVSTTTEEGIADFRCGL